MPVRAFADDSGSGGDSPYYVLGGFLSDLEKWGRFSDDWATVLGADPAIAYFKMSEAESLKKEFDKAKGWTPDLRDRKVDAFIDVINDYDLFQGTCAVHQEDYNAVVLPVFGNRFNGEYDNPYLYLFMSVVALFSSMEHRWDHAWRNVPTNGLVVFGQDVHTGDKPQPVDFVFDTESKIKKHNAKRHYEQSLKSLPSYRGKLGSVDFGDEKELLPLQAADLAAWQRRRRLCVWREPPRRHYERLHIRPKRHHHDVLNRSALQETVDAVLHGLGLIPPS